MNAQQLKNSILQMAVSGKLIPQDPNDEPASVLLDRIRKEKEKLIKEGKIKKEKNPSFIFRGADNTPYEKVGNAEPVSITDELPFEIPESWEWCRLSDLTVKDVKRGKSPTYIASSDTLVFAQKCNVKTGGIDMSLAKYLDEKTLGKYPADEFMQNYDIVVNSTGTGTMGRIGLFRDSDNPEGLPIVPDSHVTVIRLNHNVSVDYLVCCLQYHQPYLEEHGEGSTNQKELKPDTIKNLFIPLPPNSEQQRIANMITALEPYISAYGKKDSQLAALNKGFPEQLKKSILQMAVQGKLVSQNPSDEPASTLLERIRAEKERLIAEGKIKRDKNESVIFRRDNSHYEKLGSEESCIDDEIPFDIPDSWEWCRMSSILSINPRNQLSDDTIVGFMPMPLLEDGFNNRHTFEERQWKDVRAGFTHFKNNDVVVAKITPCFQNRKSAVISGLPNGYGAGTTELHVLRDETHNLYMPYILLICKTHAFITGGIAAFTGTAGQQRVGKDFIAKYLVPLPPLQEQIRITSVTQAILESLDELL